MTCHVQSLVISFMTIILLLTDYSRRQGRMSRPIQLVLLSVVILSCVQIGRSQCDAISDRDCKFLYHNKKWMLQIIISIISLYITSAARNICSAILRGLLPYINNLENNLKRDLDRLINERVTSLSETVTNLSETVTDLSGGLEDHKHQIANGLAGLHISFDDSFSAVREAMESQLEERKNQTTSELADLHTSLQSSITNTHTIDNLHVHTCGGTGGWRRVVYLDMTDPNTNCPSGWQLTGHSKRTCGRVSTGHLTCDSVTFPVSGGDYTRVCGRIKAYQYAWTDAFEAYHNGEVTTINGSYVSGVSLTHGSPQQHIWTFAAGISESEPTRDDACPCDATINIAIPPFVGGDYFCESGANSMAESILYPDDPLWDGEGCTCCSFNNPPYFTKQLPSPTTDDIEARICLLDAAEDDTPIEFIELYVQ